MPPGTQRYQRTKMVLPLRVWVDPQTDDAASLQLAHTLDISPIGARLGGLRTPVQPGQPITVQRGQHKTHFRVIWSKQLAPTEIQAGVETLEIGKKLWDVELPQQAAAEQAANAEKPAKAEKSAKAEKKEKKAAAAASKSTSTWKTFHRPPAKPRSATSAVPHHVLPPALDRRLRWTAAVATVIFVALLGMFVQYKVFGSGVIVGFHVPVPTPPTDEQLASMTPQPVKLAPIKNAEVANATPFPRVLVAEAPKGHVVYPISPSASLTGKVSLKVVIATDGRVKGIQVVSGKQLLAQAAEQAVRLWRYAQHELNGEAVEAETSVMISFRGDDAVSLRFPPANKITAN